LWDSQRWLSFWPNYSSGGQIPLNTPAADDNDKRGYKYAMTRQRLIGINNTNAIESKCLGGYKGKKPSATNCYTP
jgi:hypothetical protein